MAREEDFRFNIRHAFTVDRNIINLNNGGVSPAPKLVMDTEIRLLEIENITPTYYMWCILDPGIETARRRLAPAFGCDPEEIAITRNASEVLEIAQLGLEAGHISVPPPSLDYLTKRIEEAITPRTKACQRVFVGNPFAEGCARGNVVVGKVLPAFECGTEQVQHLNEPAHLAS